MKFIDKITEVVAGRVSVENASERAFKRKHERRGTEEALRCMTVVAPESPPRVPPPDPSRQYVPPEQREGSLAVSLYNNPMRRSRPDTRRPRQYERPRPDATQQEELPPVSLSGPPDLTAVDQTDEQLRRNYSAGDVWDRTHQRLPPLLPCDGIGRYRMSTSADQNFQRAHLNRNLYGLIPAYIDHLASSPLSHADPEIWQEAVAQHGSRRGSRAASQGAQSHLSFESQSEHLDPATGTRVVRGFTPLNYSLAASPTSDSDLCDHKDSGLGDSIPNPSRELVHNLRCRVTDTLQSIAAQQALSEVINKKMERPCIFGLGDDLENAIASGDAEDDWMDMTDSVELGRHASQLTRMLNHRKRKHAAAKTTAKRPQLCRGRTASRISFKRVPITRNVLSRSKATIDLRAYFQQLTIEDQPSTASQHRDRSSAPEAEACVDPCTEATSAQSYYSARSSQQPSNQETIQEQTTPTQTSPIDQEARLTETTTEETTEVSRLSPSSSISSKSSHDSIRTLVASARAGAERRQRLIAAFRTVSYTHL